MYENQGIFGQDKGLLWEDSFEIVYLETREQLNCANLKIAQVIYNKFQHLTRTRKP